MFTAPPRPLPAVSLLEDRTLRRGDAVMMDDGIHVFAGSPVWPYRRADFKALATVRGLDLNLRRTLAELDRQPRRPETPLFSGVFALRGNTMTQ